MMHHKTGVLTIRPTQQSWTWVQFSWPDPTRPTSEVTQPDPTQS